MGFRLVFANVKGGVGKTTLSVLVARALREAGAEVSLSDLDPQKTATHWVMRAEKETLSVDASTAFVLVDTRPTSEGVAEASASGDMYLLVASPSPADLEATKAAADILKARTPAPIRILFNSVVKNSNLHRHMADLAEATGVEHLKSHVSRRLCYQHAVALGWRALDRPAREELGRVATEVLTVCLTNKK